MSPHSHDGAQTPAHPGATRDFPQRARAREGETHGHGMARQQADTLHSNGSLVRQGGHAPRYSRVRQAETPSPTVSHSLRLCTKPNRQRPSTRAQCACCTRTRHAGSRRLTLDTVWDGGNRTDPNRGRSNRERGPTVDQNRTEPEAEAEQTVACAHGAMPFCWECGTDATPPRGPVAWWQRAQAGTLPADAHGARAYIRRSEVA